jgi:hypothetical protein
MSKAVSDPPAQPHSPAPKRGFAEVQAIKKILPPSVFDSVRHDDLSSLRLRPALRAQLAWLADEAGMTVRDFVLDALKAKGLKVRRGDLTKRK